MGLQLEEAIEKMTNPGLNSEGPDSEGRENVGNKVKRSIKPLFFTPLIFLLDGARMQPSKLRQMTLLAYANLE